MVELESPGAYAEAAWVGGWGLKLCFPENSLPGDLMLLLWEPSLSSKTLEHTTEMLRRQEGKGRDITGNLPAPPQKSPEQPASCNAPEFEKAPRGLVDKWWEGKSGKSSEVRDLGFGSQALKPISSVTCGKLLLPPKCQSVSDKVMATSKDGRYLRK